MSLLERSIFENVVSIPLYAAFEAVEGGKQRVEYLLKE